MGDSGEGLVDAEARIHERMEELERARAEKRDPAPRDPGVSQAVESLRLARLEMTRQLEETTHDRRRAQIEQAIAEIDRRLVDAQAPKAPVAAARPGNARTPSKRKKS